jgi:hypothetical protein
MSLDYACFERRLSGIGRWGDKVQLCLEGVFNNVFYRGAKLISDLNIGTLEERFPEVYETVRDNDVRRALVVSELFRVKPEYAAAKRLLEKLGVKELEIEIDDANPSWGSHGFSFLTSIRQSDFSNLEGLYGGGDAVKVFFKSIFLIAEELDSILYWPILADVWRVKSGLESRRDELRAIMYSKFKEIAEGIPEEAETSRPERVIDGMVYFLWYWYRGVGKKVKRRLETLLKTSL